MIGIDPYSDFSMMIFKAFSKLVKKSDIMRLTGFGRTHVNKITADLQHVGGKQTYFVPDVVEKLNRMGE